MRVTTARDAAHDRERVFLTDCSFPLLCTREGHMKPLRSLLIAALALLIACGSSDKTKTNDLTGTWAFTAHSMQFNYQYSGSAIIQVNNQAVNGTMTLTGSPCGTTETLQGSVVNNKVTLEEFTPTDGILATLVGNVGKDGSLSGSYTSPIIGCANGDFGTWTATKH